MIEDRPETGRVWHSRRGLVSGLLVAATLWLSSPAVASPAAAPAEAAQEDAPLASAGTLRRLKDEVAALTRQERSLRDRRGAEHAETLAVARELEAALARLDAEVDHIASSLDGPGADGPRTPRSAPGRSALVGGRGAWLALGMAALPICVLAAVGFAMMRRRTAPQRFGIAGDVADHPAAARLEVDLPASGDRDSLLGAARQVLAEPEGPLATQIRALRETLDARQTERSARTILLTSIAAETAQALLASNLAHELVRSGERTLLVDADGDATLTRILCREPPVGPAAGSIEDAVLLDQITGLWLLPGRTGGQPIPPAEIARMRRVFDTIVVSAPPLADDSGFLAEAAQVADQVVLLAAAGASPELASLVSRRLGVNSDNALLVRFSRPANGRTATVQASSDAHAA